MEKEIFLNGWKLNRGKTGGYLGRRSEWAAYKKK